MWGFQERPIWMVSAIGLAIGAAGQLLNAVGLISGAGWTGPVVNILAPGLLGVITAVSARSGWGMPGLAVGMIVVSQALPSLGTGLAATPTIDLVVSLASALVGYGIGFGVVAQTASPFLVRPPAASDLARAESEARAQLRGIDPQAPGSFERATVLLRTVNEQVGSYGMWAGSRPPGAPTGPPPALIELQAELVETARVAAIAAGARRVTITSSGMGGGIDVQAVFGDPIGADEPLPSMTIEPLD